MQGSENEKMTMKIELVVRCQSNEMETILDFQSKGAIDIHI